MEIRYNILYKGERIYENVSAEDCTEILQDFSERFYLDENIHSKDIELEEIYA